MSSFVNLLDIVYPVGSIYTSMNAESPASTVGGTWTQITDRYLKATDDTIGETGGAASYIFTLDDQKTRACIGASGSDAASIAYIAESPAFAPTKYRSVGSYTILGGSSTTQARSFNHHTPVYGQTNSSSTEPPYLTCCMWYRIA